MIPIRRTFFRGCVLAVLLSSFAVPTPAHAKIVSDGGKPAPRKPKPRGPSVAGKGAPDATRPIAAFTQPPAPPPAAAGDSLSELLPGEKAATSCIKLNPGKRYKWDLRGEIDLSQLVAWAQSAFCVTVIVPANLRQQKITIYAPSTMSPPEMYRMFLAALNAMGLTVQPKGPESKPTALVIIESARARETAIPTLGSEDRVPANDSFVTKMLRLEHLSTDDVLPIVNRLKSQPGDIIAAPPSTLIITDVAENVRRMEDVIGQLDVPLGGEKIWTVRLQSVGASEMAALLTQIFQPKGGAGGGGGGAPARPRINFAGAPAAPGVPQPQGGDSTGSLGADLSVSQIIAEDRSNTLIIVATDRAFQRILGLIQRLDQPGGPMDTAAERVHVYLLANANAEDLAGTLSGLGISVSRSGGGGGRGGRGNVPAGIPGAPGGTGQGGAGLFEGDVRVASDKSTNSLIIVASGRDYLTLRDLIRQLDITRRQVFIEATILEVSLDKARRLGVSFHGGLPFGDNLALGGVQPNQSVNSILFSPAALSGLAAGLRGSPIPGVERLLGLPPGTSVPSFGVFLQLLQNNNDVNVISMPHILTSDNEKASIQVGRNLPFPGTLAPGFSGAGTTGQTPGTTTPGFGFGFGTSVQRQDVALKLDVTPHVNDSDFVRLEVDNEISDVASENFNGLGPATDKRTVKTVIVVRDQQSVVLGGLQRDRVSEAVDKVPLLGDIPILGYFFKYSRKTILKQNLLIILTPYIIKDPYDLRRIFERKIQERREFLERYSAFRDPRDYEADIDFTKRRGLLEEINLTAKDAEEEASMLHAAEAAQRGRLIEGPVEPAPLPTSRPRVPGQSVRPDVPPPPLPPPSEGPPPNEGPR